MFLLKDAGSIILQKDVCIRKWSKEKYAPNDFEQPSDLFHEFNGEFNQQQLRQLRSIPSGKSRDSSFVLTVMRFFNPNSSVLSKKSGTGKKRNKVAKEELTPRKKTLITEMLKQRICSEAGLNDMSIFQRMERVNKLI